MKREKIYSEIDNERQRQDTKWGEQNHPILNPLKRMVNNKKAADWFRHGCDKAAKDGTISFQHILLEEVYEVFAEDDSAKQRAELIQVAAVAIQMIERIDRM